MMQNTQRKTHWCDIYSTLFTRGPRYDGQKYRVPNVFGGRPEEDVLYLIHYKQPPCGFRNVYWLTFTNEGTILSNDNEAFEYFTLGSHGLTRFKGGQGVEFSDLDGWIDEKRAFDHMTSMKGLERIQQMIFFFSWKRRTVQRRLYRVRERLACSLFTCHPVAASLLMDVRDVCAEIENEAKCEYVDTDTTYTLDILARIHQERVRVVKTSITKKIQSLCMAIDNVTRGISRYRDGQGCSYITADHDAFSKALQLSSLRERMFTFLRLVDCHVSEAVYQHVTLVVHDLRVRICGDHLLMMKNTDSTQFVDVKERRGKLLHSELAVVTTGLTSLVQTRERVTFAVQAQESDALVVAIPGLYVSLEDDVTFEGDVNSSTMHVTPTKVEVLGLVHTILMQYCVALDELPRVLTDEHFQYVLTPFVPSVRHDFGESLLKASHLVLESFEPDLREMRSSLDMQFRRIGILQQEHLRCIRAVRVAERESPVETTRRNSITALCESDEEDGRLPELPDLSSSAVAYELAQKTWNRFAQYANNAAPILQVGYLLLDQRSFVDRLRRHVSMRVAEMDDSLPLIYQRFLTSLLNDVDGRVEKVTKIPTNLAEANMWLAQVTSMMSTHPFRQRLDTKMENLARLRELIKARGLISLESEIQDSIRNLELTWESVIETLLMCLARVEERGSEHRRSVQDVITKAEEYITDQMQVIIKTFEELPSGCEENEDEGTGIIHNKLSQSDNLEEDMVQQLEDLVVMDVERKDVVLQFEEYDREHREIMDMPPLQHTPWMSSHSNSNNLSAVSLADKLASELLLLYIITALELRQWFKSWKKLHEKWLGTPLTCLHPGTMINRIKQFRRRLVYASSRLSRLSSVLLQILPVEQISQSTQQVENDDQIKWAYFARKDFELIRVFDSSIEEMLNFNRIFQAISGGAFSEARWAAMNQLLNVHVGPNGTNRGGHLTLRLMKDKCGPSQMELFLDVCDECIVEAKLHVKLEQTRQRLRRIELRVVEINYSVQCDGVPEALALLDEIAVDLKLCLFDQNTELQHCLELRAELERKVAVCEHILSYQKHWRLRCEASKLHELDEFFSKRFSGSGSDFALPRNRKSQHKAGLKQEQMVWQAFLDASHAWSDRLRRLFFVSPHQHKEEQMRTNPRSLLERKSVVAVASATPAPLTLLRRLTKSMDCTLDNVMESFEGFDFESNLAACERGIELFQNYLEVLREKTPRIYCLDETSMLRLLMRDSDMKQLHQSLAICYPRVHRFTISRAANRVGSTIEMFGEPETASYGKPERASKTNGTIVILGIEGMHNNDRKVERSGHFRLPVAKIGRLSFWFTRLEEEMSSMVQTDLKRALEWATHDFDSSDFAAYDTFLPQSIVIARGLQFTFEMNRVLRSDQHEGICHQLNQLRVNVRTNLDGLIATHRTGKTASSSVRLENMILLSAMQSEVVNHVTELLVQRRQEDAMFFWNMQFQTRVFAETISTTGSSVQPNIGKHLKVEKIELIPTNSNFLKATASNHSGQSTSMSIPFGYEFVGWGRLAILSPFTQRCSYALFSALRMHQTALVVPYHDYPTGTDPTSWLWGISQMLLRPCIEFSCNLSAGATTTHHLSDLMIATSRLNGFLIVRNLLQLSTALVSAVHERMLQHFHQAIPVWNPNMHYQQYQAVTIHSRHAGGIFYGASAIFIPLDSTDDLKHSKLVRSIRTQFRAVALSKPDITYIVECMLIADSYEVEQIRGLNVVQAFKAIDAGKAGPVLYFKKHIAFVNIIAWLLTKNKGEEEAVAAAVSIYLESAYGLPTDCEQFDVIMELWRALQTFPAALVYGSPGSGKTTCITVLHRSLMALELSEQSQENEAIGHNSGKVNSSSSLTQLVILNPQLLSLDQFYSHIAAACGNGDSGDRAHANPSKWILIDGDIDSGILDRLLESDNRACPSTSSLPSFSILYRRERSNVVSGDYSGPGHNPRLLFEVTTLANLSPSALRRCWALHIPKHYITVASIMCAWRCRWENQLVFSPESRGFVAMTVVFRTVDVLVSTICIGFVMEEANRDLVADGGDVINTEGLRLGCLSLNHITQTALALVSFCCFQNKSLLQEFSYLRLVELVTFAVLWGFGGHLPDSCKVKLENYVRVKSKEHSETKHLAELTRGLMDGNNFEDVWDELQPRFATIQTMGSTNGAKHEAKIQSTIDAISGQVLVLVPAATSLIRICTVLLYSSHSFMLVGPAASGKTSLLRWLIHRNREAEAAEMKIETSFDDRHVHGILDWTNVPAAWFNPIDQHDASSRAKMREEAELFAGISRHSFVFFDDLDASGTIADTIQIQFVRMMLDHRSGYSTKHGGFQRVEKQIGAGMRLDTLEPVPSYAQKELLSVFRVRFQQYFEADPLQASTERRLSTKGNIGGGGQQLPLEEVILRASVDFAVEMTALQQLGHAQHPCLYLFNLHHVNALLERTFVFAAGISGSTNAASEGTTLVQLGKVHQSWLSELRNIFLSNCPMESSGVSPQVLNVGAAGDANGEDIQHKISTLLHHLSEKYFSVAFRGRSDQSILTSVESLHFLVRLAEHHVQAPLLQPRLIQLRELLNQHMTDANGISRRSSDQSRGAYGGGNSTIPATELVSRVLLEIAATSTSSDVATGLKNKSNRPYSNGQLTAYETKVLLSSSWCLTQAMHLVHALSQQQQVVVSSSRHTRLLSDRLLRFACDLHGYKVHTIQDDDDENVGDQHKRILRAILGTAGVRQERVALWIREHQFSSTRNSSHTSFLLNIVKELCLEKLPSLVLLPGGHELRDELVLSCIQGRKQLEIVTEAELMAEFQQRIQKNFRLCILEDDQVGSEKDRASVSAFVRWMKTRPSCHWRRLDFTEFELQRLIPEVTRAALTSPALCGVNWDSQQVAKYVILCQNVYSLMIHPSPTTVDPVSQLEYFLSFMTNIIVTYQEKLQYHQKRIVRLESMLKTLTFVRDEVIPALEHLQRRFEIQSSQIDCEFKSIDLEQVPTKQDENSVPVHDTLSVDLEMKEARWVLQARHEELLMMDSETNLRLEQTSKFLAEWRHVTDRMNNIFTKWSQELDQEKGRTEHEIMGTAVQDSAQRVFAHVMSLGASERNECWSLLGKLILKNIVGDSSPGIEKRLMSTQLDGDTEDESTGVVQLIWTSCFSFLRDRYIYRTIRLADELCDRVPVIVDPSGVLQRFLVHTFSGHTLFSTLPGYGNTGDAESENSSVAKESMVISCDDPMLELHLQEGLRLGIPVLLTQFCWTACNLFLVKLDFLTPHRDDQCSMNLR
ncbi:LOW QUALITY PROTEIN: hypothetical protein PHPALM_16931 [Phytophthora palmivora]|uniref:Dynein heavy chain hydrolytic ATP-binding dynein motor region domain-containing protein n=1 Tax=Phytophthora palmivora TaxID=4796 RepID=A0A2P4XNH0_9STRA|nr:LOW QUALITY PROTEIN: hypothetical protein PHPALM_16931 [Phytophthora palmivora]